MLFVRFIPRDHADLRPHLPDHQQRPLPRSSLSRFTQDARGLLVGVNVGGAGTLVASLASLITFREYTAAFRRRQALSHPVFRHQLRFSGSSSGRHVLSGLSSRGLSAEKQNRQKDFQQSSRMKVRMLPSLKIYDTLLSKFLDCGFWTKAENTHSGLYGKLSPAVR